MHFKTLVGAAVLLLGTSLGAVPIVQFNQLSQTDRTQLDKLEAAFFAEIEGKGTDQGLVAYYATFSAAERLSPEMRTTFKEIDRQCGTIGSIERYKTETFGSRAVRETFVAMHGSCPIRWTLTYVRRGPTWAFDRFSFLSFDGNEW